MRAQWQQAAIIAAVLLLSLAGIKSYYKFFIAGNIYDPVAFNLLKAERMIPAGPRT